MIFDLLTHTRRYRRLGPSFVAAFDFPARSHSAPHADGHVEIIPGKVWAIIVRKAGRPMSVTQFEYHLRYADIHYCASGDERIGWEIDSGALQVAADLDPDKDAGPAVGPVRDTLLMAPSRFAVLFPGEPHAPLLGDRIITKITLKVLIG